MNSWCPGAFEYVYDSISWCYVVISVLWFLRPHCNFSFEIMKFTLPYLTLPYLTLPYLTLPYLTLPYLTLPYLIFVSTDKAVHVYVPDARSLPTTCSPSLTSSGPGEWRCLPAASLASDKVRTKGPGKTKRILYFGRFYLLTFSPRPKASCNRKPKPRIWNWLTLYYQEKKSQTKISKTNPSTKKK